MLRRLWCYTRKFAPNFSAAVLRCKTAEKLPLSSAGLYQEKQLFKRAINGFSPKRFIYLLFWVVTSANNYSVKFNILCWKRTCILQSCWPAFARTLRKITGLLYFSRTSFPFSEGAKRPKAFETIQYKIELNGYFV